MSCELPDGEARQPLRLLEDVLRQGVRQLDIVPTCAQMPEGVLRSMTYRKQQRSLCFLKGFDCIVRLVVKGCRQTKASTRSAKIGSCQDRERSAASSFPRIAVIRTAITIAISSSPPLHPHFLHHTISPVSYPISGSHQRRRITFCPPAPQSNF